MSKLAPYRKALIPATVAVLGELIALGALHGQALAIVSAINAGLGVIAGGVYAVPNGTPPAA